VKAFDAVKVSLLHLLTGLRAWKVLVLFDCDVISDDLCICLRLGPVLSIHANLKVQSCKHVD